MLHDVVEDADYDLDDLRKLGFNERVVAAVDAMSRRDGENYAEFIDRLKENPDAVIVKKADMECNMAHNCPEGLLKRYKKYYAVLEAA
jgi:(p)ppGpp synthase/HD superfamily hydrolase